MQTQPTGIITVTIDLDSNLTQALRAANEAWQSLYPTTDDRIYRRRLHFAHAAIVLEQAILGLPREEWI